MIELKHVYKIYSDGDSEIRALDDVSLFVGQGEFTSIVGSSGSGKSTCMNIKITGTSLKMSSRNFFNI